MTKETTKQLLALEGAEVSNVTVKVTDKRTGKEINVMVNVDSSNKFQVCIISCIDGIDWNVKKLIEPARFETAAEAVAGVEKFLQMRDEYMAAVADTFKGPEAE